MRKKRASIVTEAVDISILVDLFRCVHNSVSQDLILVWKFEANTSPLNIEGDSPPHVYLQPQPARLMPQFALERSVRMQTHLRTIGTSALATNSVLQLLMEPVLALCQGGFEMTSWSRHGTCLCWSLKAAIGLRARISRPHLGVYLTRPILPSGQCP